MHYLETKPAALHDFAIVSLHASYAAQLSICSISGHATVSMVIHVLSTEVNHGVQTAACLAWQRGVAACST